MEVLPPLRAGILKRFDLVSIANAESEEKTFSHIGREPSPEESALNLEDAVVVETFPSKTAADLAASLLESEGIETWVLTDDAGGAYPPLQLTQGVQLFVSRQNEEWAKEILDEMAESLPEEVGEE
jgi:hypothetical protein